jgi:hypothetical protein
MIMNELDTVVLECDMVDKGLERGDIGTIVQRYSADAVEVEFVTASGHTQALVTLKPTQIRAVGPRDMPAVRQVSVA